MADSFFGFDSSLSNLNDDEGGGEPSEDEYDALNDETFGQDSEEFDWEVQHEHLALLDSSRRHASSIDDGADERLEASLSQLVLDETDAPQSRTLGSHVWRHDLPLNKPITPVQQLKNVCTVEELERQLRQKQPQPIGNQNYFQPRYQPVILQRPPGLQAPVPLPFAPQQQMRDMSQSLNKIIGQNHTNQYGQNQLMQNHLGQNVNQMGQNVNQMGHNVNQMGQNVNQFMQSTNQMFQNTMGQSNLMNMSQNMQGMQANQLLQNQMSQNVNQMVSGMQLGQMGQIGQPNNQMGQNMQINQGLGQMGPNMQMGQPQVNQMGQNSSQLGQNLNMSQMGQSMNQMGQGMNQMGQNLNQMGQNFNQMGPNINALGQQLNQNLSLMSQNPLGQNVNQMGQNVNQLSQSVNQTGQNVNQTGQNVNQMIPNGNQFGGPGMNQFPHMMSQPRMIAPPPGMNMPRQNFSPNMAPFNNFRAPSIQSNQPTMKPTDINHPAVNQQIKNQSPQLPQKNMTNQSPNSKQTAKKTEQPKPQKSRVYNNSKAAPSQNLTSQNLVQLIQNTHPMLQLNSYHNASHHPMLNNRNVYGNNQFLNNHLFSQRHNGSFNNNRHSINGDDSSASSEDEYAGLMTQREKQWLINIQMLQLNTGTPYIHDFYYTVFLERQASKEKEGIKEAHKANQQNHPFYSGGNNSVKQEPSRSRHNSLRHNSASEDAPTPRAYVPTQFENSLGKLQCGSVTAPRKIIDVELVGTEASRASSRAPSRASTTNPNEVPRELKRTKQLLLDIEALYLVLLRLEELNDPLAISTALILKEREEKQKQLELAQKELENEQEDESNLFLKNIESVQRRPKQDSPKSESIDKRQVVNLAVSQKPPVKNLLDEDKEELVGKMFAGLLHSDRLAQMLTVRKGRSLICRFLSRVPASHARLRGVWSRVLRALPSVARRAESLPLALAQHYRSYMSLSAGWAPVLEACALLAEALEPARTPYALTQPFTLSCICALIERASALVNTPEATANERQWSKFLKTVARALKTTNLTVARPVQPLPEHKLMYHLKQLESRTTIEILQRGKSAEFVDVTKIDVQEQLVKHLC